MSVDLDLHNEIALGTKDVFSTMLMIDLDVAPTGEDIAIHSNVTSMIGLGSGLRGMLSVHCPAAVAKEITGALLGMEIEDLGDDVKDAIGEIANMVAGNLKISFAGAGIDVDLAIPTSVIGKAFRVCGLSGANRAVVEFAMPSGGFWIELLYVLNT
jgi:chemotaxis protein CheX